MQKMRVSSIDELSLEEVENYAELSYLRKCEILRNSHLHFIENESKSPLMMTYKGMVTFYNSEKGSSIYSRFKELGKEVTTNLHHRFKKSRILQIFPELSFNPFVDRIFHVFSSLKDEKMSFEDILDVASAFSGDCPIDVKAQWAFLIFDFDGDHLLNQNDISEIVSRLTKSRESSSEDESHCLTDAEANKVAEIIFNGIVLCHSEGITCVEFVDKMKKTPEFEFAFRMKFL